MNNQKISDLFNDLEHNLIIFAVTKSINEEKELRPLNIQKDPYNKFFKYQYSMKDNYYRPFNNFSHIENCLKQIGKKFESFGGKLVFVIFNEYFFGKKILTKVDFNKLCKLLLLIADQNPNIHLFFFINIFMEEEKVNKNEMEVYKERYNINEFNFRTSEQLIAYKSDKKWFSNSTFIVYKGDPIIKYSKSSFSNEDYNFNYKFGFGNLEIIQENDISKKISESIDIFICMDITIRSYYNFINRNDFSFCGDKFEANRIKEFQNLLQKYKNKSGKKKKIFIIQSNSIELSSNLDNFDENSIIIQVDPKVAFVSKIVFSDFFKEILLNTDNIHKIKKELISNTQFDNEGKKKLVLFLDDLNYFNFKKKLYSLNSMAISKNISSIMNFAIEDEFFLMKAYVFQLESLKDNLAKK